MTPGGVVVSVTISASPPLVVCRVNVVYNQDGVPPVVTSADDKTTLGRITSLVGVEPVEKLVGGAGAVATVGVAGVKPDWIGRNPDWIGVNPDWIGGAPDVGVDAGCGRGKLGSSDGRAGGDGKELASALGLIGEAGPDGVFVSGGGLGNQGIPGGRGAPGDAKVFGGGDVFGGAEGGFSEGGFGEAGFGEGSFAGENGSCDGDALDGEGGLGEGGLLGGVGGLCG